LSGVVKKKIKIKNPINTNHQRHKHTQESRADGDDGIMERKQKSLWRGDNDDNELKVLLHVVVAVVGTSLIRARY